MRIIILVSIILLSLTSQAEQVGMCERHPKTNKYESQFIEGLTTQLTVSKDPILALYRQEQKEIKSTANHATPGNSPFEQMQQMMKQLQGNGMMKIMKAMGGMKAIKGKLGF